MRRQARQNFDHSHPVDEYISSLGIDAINNWDGAPWTSAVIVQPTWDMPERIESIVVGLPVGCTNAVIKLGDRWIPAHPHPGTPITASDTVAPRIVLDGHGFLIDQNDDRLLLMTGTLTAGPTHFELMGYANQIWGVA
jgi:hypothetical protein